jgi:hypothetical protein
MIALVAAAQYLSQITDMLFEAQMQQAAIKIRVRSQRLPTGKF